ncbi:glycosyltransferase [Salinibacter ruber]|uniref:Glycosyltransferase involved in cell wall biosynthesis n=1 Tax=Salinibacter ruber TaxID=146919 RepID=A0A9X2V5D7_9BACT|nr:glycosyltransferase [Salinibacter ruber]MCS4121622.1 glycosyltransferase involved in cell wall biosynthesis [Salinibacter ruber]
MRIGILYYGPYPQNRGIEQLAHALRCIGHEPYIVGRIPSSGKRVSAFQGFPVIQLPKENEQPLVEKPIPFNPYWLRAVESVAHERNLDALIARETPLAYPVLRAARRLDIPAFLDMRENMRAMYAKAPRRNPIKRLVRSRFIVGAYESWMVPKFDHILTVSQELKDWAIEEFGLVEGQVSVLGNYPTDQFLDGARQARKEATVSSDEGTVTLIHTGWVLESRGIQDVIRALRRLLDRGVGSIQFRIVGDGNNSGSYVGPLKELTADLGLEEVVQFEPYPSNGDLPGILAASDIGVCSYHLNEHTHQTLPGKLFEYMAVGLPVFSSARRPVVRILEKEQCGVVYSDRDPETIAETLRPLIENASLRQEMGQRGIEAIEGTYNESRYVEVLETVFGRKRTTTSQPEHA